VDNWFEIENLVKPTDIIDLIRFDSSTTRMWWKHRDRNWFEDDASYRKWNTRHVGNECFKTMTRQGYYRGSLFGVKVLTHRICWVFYHGEWPDGLIDHINGDKTDNSFYNLRVVTPEENARNMGLSSTNTSGFTGVYKAKRDGAWRAGVSSTGGYKSLGVFDSFEEAAEARKKYNREFGFHEYHGKQRSS